MRSESLRLANAISLVNASLGFSAIVEMLDGRMGRALGFILAGLILDGLDGFLGRIEGESGVGKNLDSLADMVTFGIAPAIIIYVLLGRSSLALIASILYLACGCFRLARFNVRGSSRFFEGLPIPAGAMVVLSPLMLDLSIPIHIYSVLVVLVSLLMASTIPYPSHKELSTRRPGLFASATLFALVFLIISGAIWIFVGIFSIAYMLLGPLVEIRRRRG